MREWAQGIVDAWQPKCDAQATEIPICVSGSDQAGAGKLTESIDPSRPGVVAARYQQASEAQIQAALSCAKSDPAQWRRLSPTDRFEVLERVAHQLRVRRQDLLGASLADAGKTVFRKRP